MSGGFTREIRVTGKAALVILLIIAAVFAWKLLSTREGVPPEVEQRIRNILEADYARRDLPEVQRRLNEGDTAQAAEAARGLLAIREGITFASLKSRGSGRHYYVRAEIRVNGQPPPMGEPVRYFRFSHAPWSGYTYNEEVSAVSYWLPFLD
jgi:hypothetical protein